jgi:murein DD-endopeptidase MepM/ murein hydrolase activator NlpD
MIPAREWFRRATAPITLMVIPHNDHRPVNVKISAIGLCVAVMLSAFGAFCISILAFDGVRYMKQHRPTVEKLAFYTEQFNQWNSTLTALKKVEQEFRQLFSLNSRDRVLETVDTSFSGSLDIPDIVERLKRTTETVDEIKDYLRSQKDIYVATPRGYPVSGNITSGYGNRTDPVSGEEEFHSGLDISSSPGDPIRATADGVVSYSGWTLNSGYIVVLEHGYGYSTIYAHNKRNAVRVGQRVKTGDVIGYVGSTGKSTGPHVHYEVWKDGKSVNPFQYVNRRS